MVSAFISCPRRKTFGWLKTSLNAKDFPFLKGPDMQATHTAPANQTLVFVLIHLQALFLHLCPEMQVNEIQCTL